MATLQEVLNQISSISGVLHHEKVREAYRGRVKVYVIFQRKNGKVWAQEISILVLNEGTAEETAEPYDLIQLERPFETNAKSKIETYQLTHPEVEKVIIDIVDEYNKYMIISAYIYDVTENTVTKHTYCIFEKEGALTLREISKKETLEWIANKIIEIIQMVPP